MRVTIVEDRVHVRLSRRNLRKLQAMLDDEDGRLRALERVSDRGVVLVVEVEDDREHYGEPAVDPGSRPVVYACRGAAG